MTEIFIEPHLDAQTLTPLTGWGECCVVADANTYSALGERVAQMLSCAHYVFEESPQATEEAARSLPSTGKLIAVGSGTINDLCKYVSHQRREPYACIPTALSMNGYLSANASITDNNGHKQTRSAHVPLLLFADLEVLENAPKRLARAGLGDSLCRSTAQFDWLLSHLLHDTHYDETPFEWLAPHEETLMQKGITNSRALLETLLASGRGMSHVGSSAPASQAEHLIVHAMHALYPDECKELLHGEEIAVTTLIVAHMHAALLAGDSLTEAHRERLRAIHIPPAQLEETLRNAGCPTTPQALGWTQEQLQNAVTLAPTLRDRFTVLNIR